MIVFTGRTARAVGVAVALVGAVGFASPVLAAPGEILAQASSQQAMASSSASEPAGTAAVEARIRDLHKRLHVTPAQKPQWDDLTQVMRDNAHAMADLQKQRAADANSMNAVEVVKSYAQVIDAHEDGMKKFIPRFEALYNSMSDAQKKTADSLFRGREKASAAKQTAAK